MNSNSYGPRLSDREFFLEKLDSGYPGMEEVRRPAEQGDFTAARQAFGDLFRRTLQPERFFSTLPEHGKVTATQELLDKAEDACRHHMVSCGVASDFGEQPVDWFSNPTYNQYSEWTWQLSRHAELKTLAQAYRATEDERYASACAELFTSWARQATAPDPCSGFETLCWRTIECGIRMSLVWPEIIHSLYRSPAFTDDVLTDWCKSVWEHGDRLRRDYTRGNWLIHEVNGLAQIGVLYPFLADAGEWYAFALDKLTEELSLQVYPDGWQYELTTCYLAVVIRHYMSVLRVLVAYEKPVDPVFYSKIEQLLTVYIQLMRPDGHVPDLNDGDDMAVAPFVALYADLFPNNQLFRWLLSDGKEGTPPQESSIVFPYAGLAALRTGWEKDDTWVFFDGGPFGAGHQHEDKLSLLLYADGAYTLTEANRYAYDTSEMRRYVLSTRGHNTVRVDGQDQNRRKTYAWKKEDIARKSDLDYTLSPDCDRVSAVYDEGYGDGQDRDVTHSRRVLFLKQPGHGLQPFVIVVDRLTAKEQSHQYEWLWHLDSPTLKADGLKLQAGTLHVLVPDVPMETASLGVVRGQTFPEWQGWVCNSAIQMDYRPVYTAQYRLEAQNVRWVTVLYPDGGEACPIAAIEASLDCAEKTVTLRLKNGETWTISE